MKFLIITLVCFALEIKSLAQRTPLFTTGTTTINTNGSIPITVPILPLAKFKFDGNVQDTSGYSNNLIASGSVGYTNGPNGVANTAIVLGGSFLRFTNTFATYFDTQTPFTVTAWIYITNSTRQYIVGNLDNNNGFIGWDYEINTSPHQALILNRTTGSSQISVESNNGTIALNQWFLISFSYNGTSKASGTIASFFSVLTTPAISINTLSGSILTTNLARVGLRSDGTLPYNGRLTGLNIWPKCLSTNDLFFVYTNGLNGNF